MGISIASIFPQFNSKFWHLYMLLIPAQRKFCLFWGSKDDHKNPMYASQMIHEPGFEGHEELSFDGEARTYL